MAKIWRWFNLGLPFHRVAFWVSFTVSIVLIISGFLCPPLAEISSSVLFACGELFGFGTLGAAIKAIEDGKEVEIHHKETNITIGDAGGHFHHKNNDVGEDGDAGGEER